MVARLIEARETATRTRENHPEKVVAPEKSPTVSLPAMIGVCALCGLLGMTFGSAGLSTAFQADTAGEVVSLLPLMATAVCSLSGWVGAFFWMVRKEASKHE